MDDKESADVMRTIEQLAQERTLLAFQFDGALASTVPNRDNAAVRWRTARLLDRVARRYPTAVLSGRSVRDLRARLVSGHVAHVLGNHGLEPLAGDASMQRDIAEARATISRRLEEVSGVEVEDKQFSLTVHYRAARANRVPALAAIRRALLALDLPLRSVRGDDAVHILPLASPTKIEVLGMLRGCESADHVLYVGGAEPDDEIFGGRRSSVTSLRVAPTRPPWSRWLQRRDRDVDGILVALLRARGSRTSVGESMER